MGSPGFRLNPGWSQLWRSWRHCWVGRHKPTMELLHDCLNPEKDLLHLASKKPWTIPLIKFRADHTRLGWGILFIPTNVTNRTKVTPAVWQRSFLFPNLFNAKSAFFKSETCISVSECFYSLSSLTVTDKLWKYLPGRFVFNVIKKHFNKAGCVLVMLSNPDCKVVGMYELRDFQKGL